MGRQSSAAVYSDTTSTTNGVMSMYRRMRDAVYRFFWGRRVRRLNQRLDGSFTSFDI